MRHEDEDGHDVERTPSLVFARPCTKISLGKYFWDDHVVGPEKVNAINELGHQFMSVGGGRSSNIAQCPRIGTGRDATNQ